MMLKGPVRKVQEISFDNLGLATIYYEFMNFAIAIPTCEVPIAQA